MKKSSLEALKDSIRRIAVSQIVKTIVLKAGLSFPLANPLLTFLIFKVWDHFDKGPEKVEGTLYVPKKNVKDLSPWFYNARMEIGVSEIYGEEDNPRILAYHQATSMKATKDETPWCSSFVCWCFEQAGIRSTRKANARSWLNWGLPLAEPEKGCVVVFRRGKKPWQGHVGFWVGEEDGSVLVLGGNQSNSVNISKYAKERVLGYRWPISS